MSLFDAPEGFINQPKYELRDRMLARRIHQPRYVKYGSVGGDAVLAPGQKREQLHAVTAKVGGEFVKRKINPGGFAVFDAPGNSCKEEEGHAQYRRAING